MGLVMCLVLRVVSTQAENGKTKGTVAQGMRGGWIMPYWFEILN